MASRLDMFLTEIGLAHWIADTKILAGYKSDHKAISLDIFPYACKKGAGTWKLNTQVLAETAYIDLINSVIQNAEQWAAHLSPKNKWDSIKMIVIAESQEYCQRRGTEHKLIKSVLEEAIVRLEEKIEYNWNQADVDMLEKTKADLEELIESKTRGTIFRAKARWYNEGEKCTKYFMNLEKTRAQSKGMNVYINEKGQEITNPREILAAQEKFYAELYRADPSIQFKCEFLDAIPQVPNEIASQIGGKINRQEIIDAIKLTARNKTPGSDGLPIEWYIVFFNRIANILIDAINDGYDTECLHDSALEGLITLIPKKDKDTRVIANMRPITLLNADYKLVEKVLANRIRPTLFSIINSNQKGFMKGRHAAINIRKILDIIDYVDRIEEPGVILQIDFQKAFDRCEIQPLLQTLHSFGYPEGYIKWIRTVYNNAHAKVINKGYLSNSFPVTRSVKQGGPNSAFLFLLIAEIFAISIRQNKNIQGFNINDIMDTLGQFADDTDMYLKGRQKVLDETFKVIESFHQISGLKVNYDKTILYKIGSLTKTNAKLITKRNVRWVDSGINVLGVEIPQDIDQINEVNYHTILNKVTNTLTAWTRRNLSLMGKILIINTLTASLFTYKMSVLPRITDDIVLKYNTMIEKFIWNNRKPKIKLEILQASKRQGGLGLINLRIKDASLKAAWVKQISEDVYLRELALSKLHKGLQENIFRCNINEKDIRRLFPNSFWRDVLIAWSHLAFEENVNPENTLLQIIWYNSHIKVGGELLQFDQAVWDKGLRRIIDIYDDKQKKLYTAQQIQNKYDMSIIQANGLLSAIPKIWKDNLKKDCFPNTVYYDQIICKEKVAQFYYKQINKSDNTQFNAYVKWQSRLGSNLTYAEYVKLFHNIYKCTNHTKLRSFQYRLLSNAIITNRQLYLWKIVNSELCSICKKEPETTKHLLYDCEIIQNVWKKVPMLIEKLKIKTDYVINATNVIYNTVHKNPGHVINFIVLVIKSKIYTTRCLQGNINFVNFEKYINECKNIEKYNALKNNTIVKHAKKWEGITNKKSHDEIVTINTEELAKQYLESNEFFK